MKLGYVFPLFSPRPVAGPTATAATKRSLPMAAALIRSGNRSPPLVPLGSWAVTAFHHCLVKHYPYWFSQPIYTSINSSFTRLTSTDPLGVICSHARTLAETAVPGGGKGTTSTWSAQQVESIQESPHSQEL